MKKLTPVLLLLLCSLPGYSDNGIVYVSLDEKVPQTIPMHPSVTLTVQMPYEIDGLNGAGFTYDLTKAFGEYLISYVPPNNYFSIYPLVDDPEPRNLNVIVGEKIYVLRPVLVSDPMKAWTALIFGDPEQEKLKQKNHSRIHRSYIPPKKKIEASNTAKIIGMIDTTKLITQVKSSMLEPLLEVMPDISVSLRKNDIADYGTHRIPLDIVSRNNKLDILVFGLRVFNDSEEEIHFDPESFTVRCEDEVYNQVISDFQGTVPSGEFAVGYFAIIGTAEGAPNYLSPNNKFTVSLSLL